jgi:hypothetical protein
MMGTASPASCLYAACELSAGPGMIGTASATKLDKMFYDTQNFKNLTENGSIGLSSSLFCIIYCRRTRLRRG